MDLTFCPTPESSVEDVPGPRPSAERAAWLLSLVSSLGRLSIDAFQYEELRAEAVALRADLAACAVARDEMLPHRAGPALRAPRRARDEGVP